MGAAYVRCSAPNHGCSDTTLRNDSSLFSLTRTSFLCDARDTDIAMISLRRNGFVVLKNVLSDDELDAAYSAIDPMIAHILEKNISFGNRGPNRMSASGFYKNIDKQDGLYTMRENPQLAKFMRELFKECGYQYGGAGADISGPGSGYQWLHSDDTGSLPFSGDDDIRHRHWKPSMVMAHPILEEWHNRNGPLRIIPWTATSAGTYGNISKEGTSYAKEQEWNFINSWIPAQRGDVIIRDVRVLHGGTPNRTDQPRIMIALSFYNNEAVEKYPSKYIPFRKQDASLPRFHDFDQDSAIDKFAEDVEYYGLMKTM